MRRIVRAAAVLTFAAGAVLVTGAGSQAAEAGARATVHGCPSGAVCLYPGSGWNGDKPEHMYWSYGAHNLVDETGTHRVLNNQTGGATAALCKGYDGVNCGDKGYPGETIVTNMTPINSIRLAE
ncbi:hypothetical protein C5F59_022360 [Streptomyces sp. QL37]|uniref:hypothetical protein n=1 Tax=Streptomyces sp. QL37 TaxID=2093747 RepID=UPI000CF22A58|nr:hypothetical protein [Streptomyces sp. QL37]PPQ58028.1 hypothetical protein C5F59_16130 [Streptomyces sp. QL37]